MLELFFYDSAISFHFVSAALEEEAEESMEDIAQRMDDLGL